VRKPSTKGKSLACVGSGASSAGSPVAQQAINSWCEVMGKCVGRTGSSRCGIVVGIVQKENADTEVEQDKSHSNTEVRVRYSDGEEVDVPVTELQLFSGSSVTDANSADSPTMNKLAAHMQQLSSQSPQSEHQKHFQQFFQQYGNSDSQLKVQNQQERQQKQQMEQRKQQARLRMQQQNVNQLQLAHQLGLSQPMISKWVNSACSSKVVHEKLSAWLNSGVATQPAPMTGQLLQL